MFTLKNIFGITFIKRATKSSTCRCEASDPETSFLIATPKKKKR